MDMTQTIYCPPYQVCGDHMVMLKCSPSYSSLLSFKIAHREQEAGSLGRSQTHTKADSMPLHYAFDHLNIDIIRVLAELGVTPPVFITTIASPARLQQSISFLFLADCIPSRYPMNPAQAMIMLMETNPTPVNEYLFQAESYDYHKFVVRMSAPECGRWRIA